MGEIVAIHSAREGTGKSTLTANTAVLLTATGRRVGVIDASLQVWGLGSFFHLPEAAIQRTFNDYLLGLCKGVDAAYDVTPLLTSDQLALSTAANSGKLFLFPASPHSNDLVRFQREGYNIDQMTDNLLDLICQMNLDTLLIDTHAGLQEEMLLSMLSIAIAHVLAVVLRLDQGDYQGTGVVVDVAHTLGVPRIALIANQMATIFTPANVKQQLEHTYGSEVIALLPYTDEIAALGSADLFVVRYPNHPATNLLRRLAETLIQNRDKPLALNQS
ncbi:MAG: P-loop NTPase [Chloroflexales bacterium]|nr:P-loop NTPase [Chloroflexales bacterium]